MPKQDVGIGNASVQGIAEGVADAAAKLAGVALGNTESQGGKNASWSIPFEDPVFASLHAQHCHWWLMVCLEYSESQMLAGSLYMK